MLGWGERGDPIGRTLINCAALWLSGTVGTPAIQCGWNQGHWVADGTRVFPALPAQNPSCVLRPLRLRMKTCCWSE